MSNFNKIKFCLVLFILIEVNGKKHNFQHDKHHKKHHGDKRIVGGELTTIDKYPYQVVIERHILLGYYRFTCGGTIITDQHILTAGHCIFDKLRVKIGTSSIIDLTAKVIDVEKIFKHPNYTTEGSVAYNDIAVLKLTEKIKFNENANKIDLPTINSEPSNSTAVLTGWGLFFSLIKIPSLWLMKADVPVVTNQECTQAWSKLGLNSTIRDTNLCTLNDGPPKTACSGDSGGPLAQNGMVIGVVSWGVNPCEVPGGPSVYTKVSKFINWINEKIKE